MTSPAAMRELTRVDDAAIFIEDTFDEATVRSIAGTSPSAVVMLSPQRMPVDRDGYSPSTRPPPRDGSASKTRAFGVDVTNTSNSARCSSGGRKLTFSACSTPVGNKTMSADGNGANSAGRSVSEGARAAAPRPPLRLSAAPSPSGPESLVDVLAPAISREEYNRMEKERNRYRDMYRYQAELCEELIKREADAQAALQEKIIEIVALSSRCEESKRFIRQMKREMQDCKERTLPFLNQRLDDSRVEQELRVKYEGRLRDQAERAAVAEDELRAEMAALEAMASDSQCASALGKSSESLLRAAYLKNTRLYAELTHARREYEAECDRRSDAERQADAQRHARRDAEDALTRERRRNMAREEQLIEDSHYLHEEIMALTTELLEVRVRGRTPPRDTSSAEDSPPTSPHDDSDGGDDGLSHTQRPPPPRGNAPRPTRRLYAEPHTTE